MASALFMARTMTLLRDAILKGSKLERVIASANNALYENNHINMFATVFLAILDARSGLLSYVSGGHNPMLIGSRDQGYRFIENPAGMLIGILPERHFEVQTVTLNKGDTLLLYTDGITEAEDEARRLFGNEAFRELVDGLPDEDPRELVHQVLKAISDHAGRHEQSDDITLLAVRYH
jgi:sigma-B regulation protein RsbU (phosphoserine phosphatase)